MPTAISSEHASLAHSTDECLPFLIILKVLEGKILVQHVMQYYPCFRRRSMQPGWLQNFKGNATGWHTTAGMQLGVFLWLTGCSPMFTECQSQFRAPADFNM